MGNRGLLGGRGKPREKEEHCEYELSIVLPVFKYEKRIAETLERVATWLKTVDQRTEVVVVDDGSTDATDRACVRWRAYFDGFQVVRHDARKGIGAAARTGVLGSAGSQASSPGRRCPDQSASPPTSSHRGAR